MTNGWEKRHLYNDKTCRCDYPPCIAWRESRHKEHGEAMNNEQTIDPAEALRRIHTLLDATDWDSDTVQVVADILRSAGLVVRDITSEEA